MKTLADIAQKVGVSQATVSRVINGKPGVSEETRQTVMEAMQSLGMPRSEATRTTTHEVALVTPDLNNPIFPAFTTAIVTQLAQRNVLPLLCTYTLGGATENSLLTMVMNRQIDGIIFIAGNYDTRHGDFSMYNLLDERRIPKVFINEADSSVKGTVVRTDDALGCDMAMKLFMSQGHRRVALLMGDPNHYPSIMKYQAALRFAENNNIEIVDTIWTTYGFESGHDAAIKLAENGVTALLCASDSLALGAIKALNARGMRVPDDISVIGYDDSPQLGYIRPGLTTLRQPVESIARSAVTSLYAMMNDDSLIGQHRVVTFDPELVVRGSTGLCRDLLLKHA
ncbi:LacI family transcriptional regulator [Alloscardovia theropitheci]|uniref:LacI family transcriptional regulator n=1 Tax=Alloscardovia theropitheci TaxID=2496842 RepID=A0A4R0QXP7_9BIFI|nr:LacI family DNA-binding transcriptional regulator [Alloscardovia theropitheci]TCD54420.1 LacI family transcriptional regulator [Alloscardovia theropitheci]